jgi:acyl carrier protein
MTDVRTRLERCFATVFPDLKTEEIPRASTDSVPAWDSLANATLVAVIEEEFGVEIPVEDLSDLGSFGLLLDYLQADLGVR